MSRISLRAYIHEIEDLIDHGQVDQAIAHCRHILKYYPKHIDTYRMLGKAYLEVQRYGDAADIFQRVISSVPEDFVGHLGMSIVREDEGNLDDAIWHMERAFEVQPANAAVQGELRRLYGRRDGIEPPKVRLTRGALARMYVKGDLYNQAIAELRAGLSEDPQRIDLQALLARAYFLGGQRVEAAEICTAIIKKLPYCLDANQILAEILSKTERGEEAKAYAQRVHALNPYAAFISPTTATLDKVPDNAVTLEKLDWKQAKSSLEAGAQPEWASSLGVQVDELSPTNEPIPDWLSGIGASATGASQPTPAISRPEAEAAKDENKPLIRPGEAPQPPSAAPSGEAIPEWMKEAGWRPSAGEAHEEPGSVFAFEDEEASSDISAAPAELPEWLRSMAPEKGEAETPPSGVESQGLVPAWLDETPPGPSDSIVTWLEEKSPVPMADTELPPAADVEIPDWLKDLQPENHEAPKTAQPEFAGQISEMGEPNPTKGLTEELSDELERETVSPEEEAPEEAAPVTDMTDWLKGLQAEKASPIESIEAPGPAEATIETVAMAGITDWLKGIPEESSEKAVFEPSKAETQPVEEIPDWLKEVETGAGAELESVDEAQIEEEPVEILTTESVPDWMKAMETESNAELEPTEEMPPEETPLEAKPQEEVPEWLKDLEAEPGAELGPVEDIPAEEAPNEALPSEEISDWLEGVETVSGAKQESGEEFQAEEAPIEAMEPERVPEWLKGLPAEPGARLEPVEEIPVDGTPVEALPAEEVPDWLKSIEAEPSLEAEPFQEAPGEETPLEATATAELPDWIKELQTEAPQMAEPVEETPSEELPFEAAPIQELPDWLAELPSEPAQGVEEEAPVSEVPLEAAPAEGMPEWLQELKPEQVESQEPLAGTPTDATSAESISQWLQSLQQMPTAPEGTGQAAPERFLHLEEPPLIEGDTKPSRIAHSELPVMHPEEAQPLSPAEIYPSEELGEAPSAELPSEAAEAPPAGLPEWMAEFEEPQVSVVPVEPVDVETPVSPAEVEPPAMPSYSDEEAGFAWLESLAAKQGAEEALLLTPEERIETTPEWIKQELETAGQPEAAQPAEEVEAISMEIAPESELIAPEIAGESEVTETPPIEGLPEPVPDERLIVEEPPPTMLEEAPEAVLEELPAEELPEWLREAGVDETKPVEITALSDEDSAFAWLESLAVKQGASEALLMRPEDRSEETPTWIQEQVKKETGELKEPEAPLPEWLLEQTPQSETIETTEPGELLPEWLKAEAETVEQPPAEPVAEAAPPAAEEAFPAYPESQATEPQAETVEVPVEEALAEEAPVEVALPETVVEPPAAEAMPELPSWLAEMEAAPAEEEEPVWQPPEEVVPAPVVAEAAPVEAGEVPLDRINLNTAGLAELERLPGVGFIRAQSVINFRDVNGAFTSVEELARVNGFDTTLATELSQWLYIETTRPPIDAAAKDYPLTLIQARNVLLQGNQTEALIHYNTLIKTRQTLPEVIQDLQEALYRYPIDINVWQALGDAYARNGQIQDALNAYTKAEELLR